MKKILEHESNHICIISSSTAAESSNYEVMEEIIAFQCTNIDGSVHHAARLIFDFPHALHFHDIEMNF